MATLENALQVTDGMLPALRKSRQSIDSVKRGFVELQAASRNAINIPSIQMGRIELSKTEVIINNVGESAKEATGIMSKLKSVVKGFKIPEGGKAFLSMADSLTQITTKLNHVNDGFQTTKELQKMIGESANRSRVSYQTMADTVTKIGQLSGDAFGSNAEAIAFAENLNKSFVIAGASQEEIASANEQLMQGLSSGTLSGDAFNAMLETAPNVIQTIADYMNLPVESIQKMASEGGITARIFKNSMISATDAINQQFEETPATFGQILTAIGSDAVKAFYPVFEKVNEMANSDAMQGILLGIKETLMYVSDLIIRVFDLVAQTGSFVVEYWLILEPIFRRVAMAAGAYLVVCKAQAVWDAINIARAVAYNVALMAKSVAMGIVAIATGNATLAQQALNTAMLASPVGWIALAIAVLIGVIYKWVQSVGGIEMAWKIVMLGIMTACVGITNFIGDMKANVLMLLQSMVNDAINIINGFIGTLNKIPSVSIDTINNVTFGTNKALQNEAEKAARKAALDAYRSEIEADMADRERRLIQMENDTVEMTVKRQEEITMGQNEVQSNIADIATNTASMKDSMDVSSEELKLLRDLAEQEVINRFTTAEIKVEMKNDMTVNSEMDLDGIIDYLSEGVNEAMEKSAEGVYA